MKIGIIAKAHRTEFSEKLKEILQWLQDRDCETVVEDSVAKNYGLSQVTSVSREQMPKVVDAVIVFGGDGTMLSVARSMKASGAPVLGVNLGSLGFLTEVTLDELYPALERFLEDRHSLERRHLLRAEIRHRNGQSEVYHALNDAVINKGALARIVGMDAFIDDNFVTKFFADGMIIATTTGSTAYSLSAGGPIVLPELNAIIVTPICPHTLTNRPLVVPAERQVKMVLTSGEDVMLTIDGQLGVSLQEGDEVICTRSEYQIELIKPHTKNFFDVLREKLKWGQR